LRPTVRGRAAAAAWIRDALAEERSARFVFGLPIAADDRAAVEHRDYWATSAGDLGLDAPMEASA